MDGSLDLIGIWFVKKNQGVNISITGVKNFADLGVAPLRDLQDLIHDVRQSGTWNDLILSEVNGADPANGSNGTFTTFPQLGALLCRFSTSNLSCPV